MTSNNLLFFRYIANNKMSTQQEIENPSTSHEISRFIKNFGYLQKEKKDSKTIHKEQRLKGYKMRMKNNYRNII